MPRREIPLSLCKLSKREHQALDAQRPVRFMPPVFTARKSNVRRATWLGENYIAIYASSGNPVEFMDYGETFNAHFHATPEDAIAWANEVVRKHREASERAQAWAQTKTDSKGQHGSGWKAIKFYPAINRPEDAGDMLPIRAYAHSSAPGLAIHQDFSVEDGQCITQTRSGWKVSQVHTGRQIRAGLEREQAQSLVVALAPLTDWTQTLSPEDMKAIRPAALAAFQEVA